MPGAVVAPELVPVPLEGLVGETPLDFSLYLATGPSRTVLYRDSKTSFLPEHLNRLRQEGVGRLFIRTSEAGNYARRVETSLDAILRDRAIPLEQRAEVLHTVAVEIANDLFKEEPTKAGVHRAELLFGSTASLVLREQKGFHALRQALRASPTLANHAMSVGVLSLGLARHVLEPEPRNLAQAALAGLLHDVGRIGHEDELHEKDPEHAQRGHDLLQDLGIPAPICECALLHHERWDGKGFPNGLAGDRIPPLVRIVAIVNLFEKVYSKGQRQEPRLGVFDTLRVLAQVYRGCFDERLAVLLVQIFR